MSKHVHVKVQLESQLKDDAEKILNSLGVSIGEAVAIFLNQVVLQKGFPFDVRIPNEETIRAFKETESNKDRLRTYDSPKELFEEMDKW